MRASPEKAGPAGCPDRSASHHLSFLSSCLLGPDGEQPGRHRRILFTGLLAYTERLHADRRAALDQMTGDATEAGVYGGTPEDYAAALKRARRQAAHGEDAS
jgi:hypothetical protein